MSDLPPPDRKPLGASLAAWLLGVGLLGTGVIVGVLLLQPAVGLPSWWYVLPVVAPYLLLGVAAMLARRSTTVLAASMACVALHWAQGTAGAGSPVETSLATYSLGLDLGEARLELDNDWAQTGDFPAELESHVRNAAAAGYLLTYRPERGAAGVCDRFRLEARPLRYGETGLRSYLLDESGVVHATPEPRTARPDDPMADDCELLGSAKTCSAGSELAAGERWPRRPGLQGLPQAPSTPAAPPPAGERVAGVTEDGTVVVITNSSSPGGAAGRGRGGGRVGARNHNPLRALGWPAVDTVSADLAAYPHPIFHHGLDWTSVLVRMSLRSRSSHEYFDRPLLVRALWTQRCGESLLGCLLVQPRRIGWQNPEG